MVHVCGANMASVAERRLKFPLAKDSSVAPRRHRVKKPLPWAEAHGYRHGLAPRGPRNARLPSGLQDLRRFMSPLILGVQKACSGPARMRDYKKDGGMVWTSYWPNGKKKSESHWQGSRAQGLTSAGTRTAKSSGRSISRTVGICLPPPTLATIKRVLKSNAEH